MKKILSRAWKPLSVVLVVYTITAGLLLDVPRLNIVNETIRALYFHVPMWFTMMTTFFISIVYSIRYLRKPDSELDIMSVEFANVGLIFGILGILTGMIWANYAWGAPWHGDPKQNGSAITTLIYLAYFVLRSSLSNAEQRAKISAVYNLFAFAAMIPLLFIIPRMTSSMHPGNGGNPAFNMYDLDDSMKKVFYPASLGWILLGIWIATVRIRLRKAEEKILDLEYEKTN